MAGVKDIKGNAEIVTVSIGGKERTIKYDMNAFAELEKMYGSVDAAMESLSEGSISSIKKILWAGLIHDEVETFDEFTGEPLKYKLTPYQLGAMIGLGELNEVSGQLTKAMIAAMPNPENLSKEVKDKMAEAGIELPSAEAEENGIQGAVVELTPEEAAREAELKNA